jgi:Zn-dependent peptidase ImmA (M78 family)/transcriptional regulator with XRE-family HTH domain
MKLGVNERIGKRLRNARKSLGLSQKYVSERMGFNNYQILTYIEKGERPIKVGELSKLCEIYSKDYSYFLEENPAEPNMGIIWRKDTSAPTSPPLVAKIGKCVKYYSLLEELTGETGEAKLRVWPTKEGGFRYREVRDKAEEIVHEWELGYRPGVNLATVLSEKYGFKIIFLEMGVEGSGATVFGDYGLAIIINTYDAPWRRNFDLAHELFHVLSMKTYPIEEIPEFELSDKDDKRERLANAFASSLLMPRNSVKKEFSKIVRDNRVKLVDLVNLAQEFSVSTEAILWRLHSLRIISRDAVRDLKESPELSEIDKRQRQSKNDPELQFSNKFVALGLKALAMGKISKGKFCEIFDIRRPNFVSFISKRGFSEDILYGREIEANNI